jgi:Fic family protein
LVSFDEATLKEFATLWKATAQQFFTIQMPEITPSLFFEKLCADEVFSKSEVQQIDITKLEDRDAQEVVGYFETLDTITHSFQEIAITESNLKSLHNLLMRHCTKDQWHKGNYKQHNNAVEATLPDGTRQIIFKTTEAGFATEDAMRNLVVWYAGENQVHALIKAAAFAYEFLSIHPFQDGNGRLSRLLSTLLLMQSGYLWVQYVSFEREIENRKTEYYSVLRSGQAQRPNENITEWILFFLDALNNIQSQLLQKLEVSGSAAQLTVREKSIVTLVANYPGIQLGEIAERLGIPSPTVKRLLAALTEKGLLEKKGLGRGTSYTVNIKM